MRALRVHELTGPDGLRLDEVPEPPQPTNGPAVRVAVAAAGVGFVDTLLARGRYQVRPDPPFTPGLEVCGVVTDAPTDSGVEVGQSVVGHVTGGAFADAVWVPTHLVAPLPEQLSHPEGAAMVVNYHTAYVALTRRARLVPGERVLVHGAGGGLGSATVQVAAALGAEVLAVTGSPERGELARRASATTVYGPAEWFDAVRSGGGVNVIVDPVGGEVFEQSIRCLAREGRLVTVGFTSGTIPKAPANRLLLRNASVVGAAWRELVDQVPELFASTAHELETLIGRGMRPLVGARYDLTEGAAALRAIEERSGAGKVVLTVDPAVRTGS